MALEFETPDVKLERLKILVYGDAGQGKSTLACSFPNAAIFDIEDTLSKPKYQKLLIANNSKRLVTRDIDKIMSQVMQLRTTKHDFKTVCIDSLSKLYELLCLEAEKKVGSDFGKDKHEANKKILPLINLLLSLDMHIIVICRSKDKYTKNMQTVVSTYNGSKDLDFEFDLVLETHLLGKKFNAIVKKTRLEEFQMYEEIDFNYSEVARRIGKDVLDIPVKPVELASQSQVDELAGLIVECAVPQSVVKKWLDAAKCAHLNEMTSDVIQKCIDSLQDKVSNKGIK